MLTRALLAAAAILAVLAASSPALAQEPAAATICQIQGTGAKTGMEDVRVVVEGIVTGDFVDATDLDGFFIQAPGCDDDPATSDGLWVYDGNRDVDVDPGQRVRVTGRVSEHYDLTEVILDTLEVVGPDDAAIAPVGLDLPHGVDAASAYLEPFEGMVVDPGPVRVVGATNAYGETYTVPAQSDVTRIFRGRETGLRLGVTFPNGWRTLDHGDVVRGAVGPLNYTYGNFKVAVGAAAGAALAVTPSGITPDVAPPAGPGELTLASYNLENFFDTVDDPGKNDTEWTPSPERYAVNVTRRARSIGRLLGAPDILGVSEVEKIEVLHDLAAHPELAAADYGAVLVEGADARGIDVGLMYRRARFRVLTATAEQHCGPMDVAEPKLPCTLPGGGTGWMLYSRPPLLVRLARVSDGGRLNVIVNHFKSKRGGDDETTPVRVAMAQHNLELAQDLRAREPGVPVIVMGDLNDFEDAGPLRRLTESGELVNLHLVPRLSKPEDAYSFIFNGVSQILDHILVEPSFEPHVMAFGSVHINVDFGSLAPDDDSLDRHRTADHDPELARIDARALPVPNPSLYLPALLARAGFDGPGGEPTPPPTGASIPASPTPVPPTAPPTARPATATNPPPTARPTAVPTPAAGQPPRTPLRIVALFFDGEEPQREGDEYIELTNVSTETVFLTGWRIVSVQGPQTYTFPDGTRMDAGQTCRVYTDEVHPEHCGLSWGSDAQAIWANAGDKAEIYDAGGRLIDWYCYGNREGECR